MSETTRSASRIKRNTLRLKGTGAPAEESSHLDEAVGQSTHEEQTSIGEERRSETVRRSNRYLQYGFTLAVLVGFLFALAGLWDKFPIWLGLAGPLASICFFFIFGQIQRFGDHTDTRQQFADSCYFLGFLLTMIAMLVGFLPAGLLGEEITSQGILRHFSMALGATALGLIFRIFILQGGRSLDQLSSEIETDLLNYARGVSEEAKGIADELALAKKDLIAHRESLASLVREDFPETVGSLVAPLNKSATEIASHLAAQSEKIAASATQLQAALDEAASDITLVENLRGDAHAKVTEGSKSISEALTAFSTAIAALKSELRTTGAAAGSEIQALASALADGAKSAPKLHEATEALKNSLSEAEGNLSTLSASTKALRVKVDEGVGENGRLFEQLSSAQTAAAEAITNAGAQAANAISAAAKGTARDIEENGNKVSATLTQIEKDTSRSIGDIGDNFQVELGQVSDRLAEILRDFALKLDQARELRR